MGKSDQLTIFQNLVNMYEFAEHQTKNYTTLGFHGKNYFFLLPYYNRGKMILHGVSDNFWFVLVNKICKSRKKVKNIYQ